MALGRINFGPHELSGSDPAKPARDWSRLESRLRDLAKPSSPASSPGLAVEPQVTLAHDPRDPLEAFEQFSRGMYPAPSQRSSARAATTDASQATDQAALSGEPQSAAKPAEDPKPDPLELLAPLAAIPTKQS